MFKMKRWMKPISRMMVLNMLWLVWAVTPAEAEPVQTASLMNPENYSNAEDFQSDTVSGEFRENLPAGGNVHRADLDAAQNDRLGEDRKFPEKNSVLANVGNVSGFIITYSTVMVGYLVLYVPLGSYGAAKCVFDREGWNDCWNAYMNRTFH